MIFTHDFILLITYQSYGFMVFLTALILNFIIYGSRYILKQIEHKEDQKDEFLGYTMTTHGFKLDIYGFYTSQFFQQVQDHPIRSSNEKDTVS